MDIATNPTRTEFPSSLTVTASAEATRVDGSLEHQTTRSQTSASTLRGNGFSPLQRKLAFGFGALMVLGIRVVACLQNPATALDLERMIYWGLALNKHGMGSAASPLKTWGVPMGVAWRDIPVNYPVIGLFFFRAISAIMPSVGFAKLLLTGIEAINAALVLRFTKSRTAAFVYWASPLSIFWVSGEGQFEPVQNLFALVGLVLVGPAPLLAGFAFALAIQTKLSSTILVAYVLYRAFRRDRHGAKKLAIGLGIGLIFSLWVQTVLPLAQQVVQFSGLSHVRNFGFNPLSSPDPTFVWRSIASTMLVIGCGIGMFKTKTLGTWFPVLGFLLLVKFSGNIQPWYLLLVPVLALSIPGVWNRRLLVLNGAVDLVALVGIVVFAGAAFHQPAGTSDVRTKLTLEAAHERSSNRPEAKGESPDF